MTEEELRRLCSRPEGQLLEFKREWYKLTSAREKAKFARDVIAMANGLVEGQVGHIVIGRDDPDRGGEVVGIAKAPTAEQVTEILGKHAQPVPSIRFYPVVAYGAKSVSIIEVHWSRYHPHYSSRDLESVLSTDRVVVRQGKITRHLSPPELEMMIRAKDARIGSPVSESPIVAGFVDLPTLSGSTASVRLRNVSEEPIDHVSAVVDINRLFPPGFTFRRNLLHGISLGPGETNEFSFRPGDADYYHLDGTALKDHGKIWSRWIDLVLHVTYRDRNGLLRSITRRAALGG